ncbi:MAG: cheV [Acidimicrobiaceae bacterium]|nr:MAG: cheV [Acidimicrobiaceae bacterium]
MNVRIPTPLRSYTGQAKSVEASGGTVAEVLFDLDRQFSGLRFRVVDEQGRLRQHMKVFVNADMVRDLATAVCDTDEITLMQALSGGCGDTGRLPLS